MDHMTMWGRIIDWLWAVVAVLASLVYRALGVRIDKLEQRVHDNEIELHKSVSRLESESKKQTDRIYDRVESARLETKGDLQRIEDLIRTK